MIANSYIVNTPSGQYTIQQPTGIALQHQPQQIIHHVIPQHRPQSSIHGIHHNERPLVRGKTSPYGFFVKMCYEEHKKKYPNECVQVTEISKKCSQKWKTMTDDEKKRFFELAQKDAERYQAEVAAYGGEDVLKKKKRAKKDPNAPKRALSAFFFFSNEKRQEVSGEHPEWKVGQIAQELGLRWKALSDEERAIYEKKAQEDKERYAEEMRIYRNETSSGLSGTSVKAYLGGSMISAGDLKTPNIIGELKPTEHMLQASNSSHVTTSATTGQPQMVILQQQPQQQGQPAVNQLPMQILEEHTTSQQQQCAQSQQHG